MLVCVSSTKGAPGVSSWAMMLAAAWPHNEDRILVEADCSGGVVGVRFDLPVEPGLSELAAATREGSLRGVHDLSTVSQMLASATSHQSALWVVPSPATSRDTTYIWRRSAATTVPAMAQDPRLWLVDCGRVTSESPSWAMMDMAAVNFLVADSELESILVLQARVRAVSGVTAVLIIGPSRYTADELKDFLRVDYLWKVPYRKKLSHLASRYAAGKSRQSKLWREVVEIADNFGLAPGLRVPNATSSAEVGQASDPKPPSDIAIPRDLPPPSGPARSNGALPPPSEASPIDLSLRDGHVEPDGAP